MPRQPSRAARFGTRFHLWVERYFGARLGRPAGLGQQQLVDPDDLPDRADVGTHDEEELRELCDAFAAGGSAARCRTPSRRRSALRSPAGWSAAGSTRCTTERPNREELRFRVVDWKTSRTETADPLQLAIYRLAWAEANRIAGERGGRGVLLRAHRQSGPARATLPDRAELGATAERRELERPITLSSVINWAVASDLDRVDHHRHSADWVAGLWRAEDAKLLKLDAESRFTTNTGGSKLRMTKPFVEFDSQRHRLLGLLNGSPIFAVETLTEGEVHDLREVGFQLSDNERDIAAAAAAIIHWHRAGAACARSAAARRR